MKRNFIRIVEWNQKYINIINLFIKKNSLPPTNYGLFNNSALFLDKKQMGNLEISQVWTPDDLHIE